jgi:hypothetical protein
VSEIELDEDQFRSAQDAAKRCIVLYAVLAAGHEESRPDLAKWLRQEGVWDAVSPEERALLASIKPTRRQVIEATWRAEALVPLLWALGKIDGLDAPVGLCDVAVVQGALPELLGSLGEFVSAAVLRPDEEIWEVHEAVYQAHWAVRDAELNSSPIPDGLIPGVIQERHHALNWLTGYCNQDWDDVTTDT